MPPESERDFFILPCEITPMRYASRRFYRQGQPGGPEVIPSGPNVIESPHPFGYNPAGIGQGQALGRLVIDDRFNNVINTVTVSMRGSGVLGALFNMATGFAENNRKLIWGENYHLKKGQFSYPFPVAPENM